jgi:hypothetical protein
VAQLSKHKWPMEIGSHLLNTRTIRFRNPRKLGANSESWLRQEVRALEWTAAICRYLEGTSSLWPGAVAAPLLVLDMSEITWLLV